jgi:hypothetical protein
VDLKDLEELKKALCEDKEKRIKKLEGQLWWFTTLAFSNLVVMLLFFLKGVFVK